MFEEFIDEFIPVYNLREYLKTVPLKDDDIADIVFNAPKPLIKKREALYKLEKMDIPKEYVWNRENWLEYRDFLDEALNAINSENAVFIVTVDYTLDEKTWEDDMCGVFSTYEAAFSCAMEDAVDRKEDASSFWYTIDLRIKHDRDEYEEVFKYYIIDGELCYVDSMSHHGHFILVDGQVYLPVPYEVGDIMISGFNFYNGNVKFLIVEVGDNRDCCCIQGLSKDSDGRWYIGAVKHGMIGDNTYPQISTLYSAVKYEPDVSNEDDLILKKASDLIKENEKVYEAFRDRIDRGINGNSEMLSVLEDEEWKKYTE